MRKITATAVDAFYAKRSGNFGNTAVIVSSDDEVTLTLHGNPIAKLFAGDLYVTTAGWDTATTKERLNALHGVSVCHVAKKLYLNGVRWDGEWKKVC